MRTPTQLRQRYSAEQTSPGLSAVNAGAFGFGSPVSGDEIISGNSGFWQFHLGDIFLPGTGNWVIDASLETAMQTNWGHGFLFQQNPTPIYQQPQVQANPNLLQQGVRGVWAGQILMQPLISENPAQPISVTG